MQNTDIATQQQLLRKELRQARCRVNLSPDDVANGLEWSSSKMHLIENSPIGVSMENLRSLLNYYLIDDEIKVREFTELAKASKAEAWWDEHQEFRPARLLTCIALEQRAFVLRQYISDLVPGLLQTPKYAEALMIGRGPRSRTRTSKGAVELRIARQRLLHREEVQASFVISETALRQPIGTPEILREQLHRIKEVNQQPNITIQVLSTKEGWRQNRNHSFRYIEFPEPDLDPLIELNFSGPELVFDLKEVNRYANYFAELAEQASAPDELDSVIDDVLVSLPD